MKKEIIINSTANEHRIAILEDGKTAELFVETPGKVRNVGDIYLGKIAKVMPGIRAAFVDIGMNQDAFLHFSDVGSIEEFNTLFDEDEDEKEEEAAEAVSQTTNGTVPAIEVDVACQSAKGTGNFSSNYKRTGREKGRASPFGNFHARTLSCSHSVRWKSWRFEETLELQRETPAP